MYPSEDQPENVDCDTKILVEGESNQGSKEPFEDQELESGRAGTTQRNGKMLVTGRNFVLCNAHTNEHQSVGKWPGSR